MWNGVSAALYDRLAIVSISSTRDETFCNSVAMFCHFKIALVAGATAILVSRSPKSDMAPRVLVSRSFCHHDDENKVHEDFSESNRPTLLVELEKAKRALTQKYSFHSVGAFDAQAYDLEGIILFETLLITQAVDWLAKLSIDPNSEIRRSTLSVFSKLQAAY